MILIQQNVIESRHRLALFYRAGALHHLPFAVSRTTTAITHSQSYLLFCAVGTLRHTRHEVKVTIMTASVHTIIRA